MTFRNLLKVWLAIMMFYIVISVAAIFRSLLDATILMLKFIFLSVILSAFLATIENGLKPITAETVYITFFGMNFIAMFIYHSFRFDKDVLWDEKDDATLDELTSKLIKYGDDNLKPTSEKQKNDHAARRLEDISEEPIKHNEELQALEAEQ